MVAELGGQAWIAETRSRIFQSCARWCPSSLAKLVQISPIIIWFIDDISIVKGFLNQLITGGGTTLL